MSGRKKLVLLGSLAAVVCVGFHLRLWVGKPVRVAERVGSTAICRIVRVHLPDPPSAFTYALVARKKTLQLVRPPSTQPKVISPSAYAMMTGDGSFETVSSEEEQLSWFGQETAKWQGPAYVDVSFVDVDNITGVADRLRRGPGIGDTVGIAVRVVTARGGEVRNIAKSLTLPPTIPGSPVTSLLDSEVDWIDDELVLETYTGTLSADKDKSFRVDVLLRRRRKP